jgi:hypothetical protein
VMDAAFSVVTGVVMLAVIARWGRVRAVEV